MEGFDRLYPDARSHIINMHFCLTKHLCIVIHKLIVCIAELIVNIVIIEANLILLIEFKSRTLKLLHCWFNDYLSKLLHNFQISCDIWSHAQIRMLNQ